MLRLRSLLVCIALSALLLCTASHGIREADGSELPPEPSVTLAAVGDILLTRGVQRKIDKHGRGWPFEEVAETLKSADLAICNLECPLSSDGIKVNKPICFKANRANVKCLVNAGFDIASVANNHALDCGRSGLTDTMEALAKAGISQVGAGSTLDEAAKPLLIEKNGLKIAILARNQWLPECVWLRPDAVGIAAFEPDTIEEDIRSAALQADVVIVTLHWGIEYRRTPEESQVELAHKMIDAGADLILGHHPHVLQPVENYHDGVIAYSLGNFLFDSPFEKCKTSTILKCRLTRLGVSEVESVPVRIEGCRPVL